MIGRSLTWHLPRMRVAREAPPVPPAELGPGARVGRVFDTTGFDNMRDSVYGGAPSLMLYAGENAEAKDVARELATVPGFDVVDAGALTRARALEHLAVLWISLAMDGAGGSGARSRFGWCGGESTTALGGGD